MNAPNEPDAPDTEVSAARRGLDTFDEMFLERPVDTAPEPPATFEERALAATGNPLEEIDRVFRRTASRVWLGVVGIAALVAALVVWGVVAERVVTTQATTVLVPESGLYPVGRLESGLVIEIRVDEGDTVDRGAVLAVVQTPEAGPIEVTAPIDGVVALVETAVGQPVGPGSTLFLLASTNDTVAGIAILGPGSLTSLAVGQEASIAVSSVNSQSYGRIRARVASIDDIPLSRARLESLLGDSADLFARQGPLYEATLTLETDPTTPSGYAWTVAQGPPNRLPLGTLGTAHIVVDRQSLVAGILG